MRVCVYGLGAMGGMIATRLAAAGVEVSAVARGALLAAVRRDGLTLTEPTPTGDKVVRASIRVSDRVEDLGEQDLVVIAVKSTAVRTVAGRVGPLMGPDTCVLSTMNGIAWWFFAGLAPELRRIQLESVDPAGELAAALPASRVLGAVLYLSASTPRPGLVRGGPGDRVIIGEATGGRSPRTDAVADVLRQGGFTIETSQLIQRDIWFKLWGNMTMNPISAITGATLDRILDDPQVRRLASTMMAEAAAVGERLGLPISADPEERHRATSLLGAAKTSMLQDVEAGRPIELDALVTAVTEIGRLFGLATPSIDAVLGLTRLHARVRGLYP
ncbi:2-dehydropantoate 2-reductase [Nonomuraea lactucae]|uniref:2-dehydropantoate 2-reductase n=1 Tax=Nonomuraea lactucae TaxID=2249762 RepID=UPI000DE54BD3|nr:2-dehydropantoate 2-reductase [Nonomuraea lactucae]